MPSFEVEFEVFCSCGAALCQQSKGGNSKYRPKVTVEPCKKCMGTAEEKGYDNGHKDGLEEGLTDH